MKILQCSSPSGNSTLQYQMKILQYSSLNEVSTSQYQMTILLSSSPSEDSTLQYQMKILQISSPSENSILQYQMKRFCSAGSLVKTVHYSTKRRYHGTVPPLKTLQCSSSDEGIADRLELDFNIMLTVRVTSERGCALQRHQ